MVRRTPSDFDSGFSGLGSSGAGSLASRAVEWLAVWYEAGLADGEVPVSTMHVRAFFEFQDGSVVLLGELPTADQPLSGVPAQLLVEGLLSCAVRVVSSRMPGPGASPVMRALTVVGVPDAGREALRLGTPATVVLLRNLGCRQAD